MNIFQENYEKSMANRQKMIEVSKKFSQAGSALQWLHNEKDAQIANQKYNTAVKRYKELLNEGFKCVYYGLFSANFNGICTKNLNSAWDYLQKGVEAGDNACKGELASMYLFGCNEFAIKPDVNKAKEILLTITGNDKRILDNPLLWMKYSNDDHSDEFKEGLIKIFMCRLVIYLKHGGFGEDNKQRKKQVKLCKKMVRYYSKYDYFAEKWARQIKREYHI